jgi:CDGSH-type Zn-finger protein/uncharacterized Fe-S cluster protein YjdI
MAVKTYRGSGVEVLWDAERCIHSRKCVLSLPGVFVAGGEGPWIRPDEAAPAAVAEVGWICPSGAIRARRLDGGPDEAPPSVNTLRLQENGPYEVRGEIVTSGVPDGTRRVLCRCGLSGRKPYCDNSHAGGRFVATGEVAGREGATLEARDGPLAFTPIANGPLRVSGNLEIIAGSGRRIATVKSAFLCRCGRSGSKPFCDGTHKRVGFVAEGG